MSINRVVISGNITHDPKLRTTANGKPVLKLGVAVNDRKWNPQAEQWEEHANYVDCVLFGKRAEALSKHLSKGQKVAIEGKLRYSAWEKEGQKRSKLEVFVDEIEFMSAGKAGKGGEAPAIPAPDTFFDDDMPF